MVMVRLSVLAVLFAVPCSGFRARHNKRTKQRLASNSCASYGCGIAYNRSRPCQCNDLCGNYGNCCSDYSILCEGAGSCSGRCGDAFSGSHPCQCNSQCDRFGDCCNDYGGVCLGPPSPTPPSPVPTPPSPVPTPPSNPTPPPAPSPAGVNATQYWQGVDMSSKSAVQTRLRSGYIDLSYGDLWNFYKEGWVNLPGQCQGGVYEVYSSKCWTPGTGQCGNYRQEGDCYNREHSWPKSWWGGSQNDAYTDLFHVMPSDGYVNGRRSSHPFGEVNSPVYVSSEGNKVGSCSTAGISGTCFEPTDRVKGLLARGSLYMAVRYMNEWSGGNSVVNGATPTAAYASLLLKWSVAHPPAAWEIEFNNRAQGWQGNRNPFIDYPQTAQQLFR